MKRYLLQLMLSKGIGDAAIKKIIKSISLNSSLTFEDYCKDPLLLQKTLFRPKSIDETMQSIASNEHAAEMLLNRLKSKGITIITEADSGYPEMLKRSLGKDCPPILFLKGNMKLLNSCCVGFCGSRKVSEKGKTITKQCAAQLAAEDITIVSGYAGGTDIAAHRAALEDDGNTIFVLPEGILSYKEKPEVNSLLNDQNHLFVSQFRPDSAWTAANAMRRNSVIMGLSKAMILVEAGTTGGTFAAGEESLKRKIPLFVIDYAKPEVSAEANPYFIEHGGRPIRSRGGVPNLDEVIKLPTGHYNKTENEQISLFG